jgi:cyanophycinase
MNLVPRFSALVLAAWPVWLAAQTSPWAPPEIGPARGTLMIIGGGDLDEALWRRCVDLAGGNGAPFVLIPTAMEGDDPFFFREDENALRKAGAGEVRVLHTRDRARADSADFVAPLQDARGVFFTGGRQWRLADAYLNTRTHRELRALLDRGGTICGTSAGATIQGSFLVRGDTKGNTVMIGDHVEGMGFLKNVAIDQHLFPRNRLFDMVPVIEKNSHLLGIGLDENTAIVVWRDRFEVVGRGHVVIYDHGRKLDSGAPFYLLSPGDRYNLKTREAERPETKYVPLERVVKEPWTK